MQIELKACAVGARDARASARIVLDAPERAGRRPPRWIGSAVASIIGVAGAITALPEASVRLPPRAVLVLHFVATVGTSVQPLIVTVIAALIAAIEHRARSHGDRVSSAGEIR